MLLFISSHKLYCHKLICRRSRSGSELGGVVSFQRISLTSYPFDLISGIWILRICILIGCYFLTLTQTAFYRQSMYFPICIQYHWWCILHEISRTRVHLPSSLFPEHKSRTSYTPAFCLSLSVRATWLQDSHLQSLLSSVTRSRANRSAHLKWLNRLNVASRPLSVFVTTGDNLETYTHHKTVQDENELTLL